MQTLDYYLVGTFELEPTVRAEPVEASRRASTRVNACKWVDADSIILRLKT